MMANKHPAAAAAFASDDEGQDYDPVYNYGSSSDYEEDKYQHTQAHSTTASASSKTVPPPAQQHNYGYSDDDSEDDYYKQQQHNQNVRQVVSPSSVALPTSPVSSRGGPGAGGYDPYSDRRDSYPTPSSHVASVAAPPASVGATATNAPVQSSRNSWEEDDSEDEPYAADAYDYGQEEESSSGDEYEERPRSSQVQKQQPAQASHGYGDRDDSEDEFEERPRSHIQHQQQQQQQPPAAVAQGHNNYAADSHSEDEYEERPRSHIQPNPQTPSSNHYHADSQSESEDEFEERPRSHQQQQQQFHGYNDQRAADSQSEDEYEERPRSHVQQRQSTQSNHAHTDIAHVAQKEQQQARNPYNYDSDYSRSSSESHRRQAAPVSAASVTAASVSHQEEKQHNGRYSTESFDRRSSYEEEKALPAVTQAAPAHYGSDSGSDSDDDYKPTLASSASHQQQTKETLYEDFGEEPAAASINIFQSSDLNPRASVISAKSSSSHTKHHSFGYDERPAEHDVPSESESGSSSSSESESEKKNKLKELSSTLMSAVPMSPPTQQAPPPVPSKSRPASTFSLASRNSLASPRSPTFARSMGSPVDERWEQPAAAAAAHAPDSPVIAASAGAPIVAAATAAAAMTAAAAATAAAVGITPTPAPTPAPVTPVASVTQPSPAQDTAPLAVDTVSQKSASSASSLDARQKNSGYDSDTSGTSIDLHSPTYKNRSKMTPPSVFTRTFSSSSGVKDNKGPASPEKTRPISYATVFSDADMNDVNLMDEPLATEQRASVVVPRTPVTPSAFGFTSNFFGGGAARSQPTPPPPSSSLSQPQQVPLPATPVQAAPVTPAPPTPPPKANDTRSRSTSISAFASSIGAFARGFSSSSNQPPVPPLPTRTPSQISQRTSNAPSSSMFAAFGQQQQQQDPRNSVANRSMTSARASTISNATNDSNMDMLLARLEAQNELLAQESKRRATTESDMDRALSHAKEEAAPGDDVDWGKFFTRLLVATQCFGIVVVSTYG